MDPATTKYAKRCNRVIYPSIRSKLLQKLFSGFSEKSVANAMTPINAANDARRRENRARYFSLMSARYTHATNMISTMMRNAKFFPVIKGKNKKLLMKSAMNGSAKSPTSMTRLSRVSICMGEVYPHTNFVSKVSVRVYPVPLFLYKKSGTGLERALLYVPLNSVLETIFKTGFRFESEFLLCAGGIEHTARLTVWFRRGEADLARERHEPWDETDKLFDRYLPPRAKIDRFRLIVPFGCFDDSLRRIFDIEKLPRRSAGSPRFDECLPFPFCVGYLPDQSGNDMRGRRVEIVSGTVEVDRQ